MFQYLPVKQIRNLDDLKTENKSKIKKIGYKRERMQSLTKQYLKKNKKCAIS